MMTFTFSAEVEAMLMQQASRQRTDPHVLAEELLKEALEIYERDYVEAVEGIRRGWEDCEAARVKPAEEVFKKLRAHFNELEAKRQEVLRELADRAQQLNMDY